MAADTTSVSIELLGAEPIEGALRVGGGEPQSFRGWLQLTPLLEAAARGGSTMRLAEGRDRVS